MTDPGLPESPDEMPEDDRDSIDDTTFEQLDDADLLDGSGPERDPEDPLDAGWVPNETTRGIDAWGVTPDEEAEGEPLSERIRHEIPEDPDDERADGLGDASDTDGELYDDEVGTERSGRLVLRDEGDEGYADDVGVDGAAASAEEAAMHTIDE
ncbi:DUF5709 domain-containing protein [Actinomycetospora termitidis]|uniref:DUF5709 domain-containing protein n=1 Tax=Actinomycetospora termitidis TaxID=3053470 RepID=A0ABT7M187_9PSEU|nr:DUF5709 domain-containing protein [Actinomycetospora sp. Odt1-22]MDL5154428.1 DUF5709 domain-containing protein [Actinomycetospora sp. Odt1-22]